MEESADDICYDIRTSINELNYMINIHFDINSNVKRKHILKYMEKTFSNTPLHIFVLDLCKSKIEQIKYKTKKKMEEEN